jgi:hypothetical protein
MRLSTRMLAVIVAVGTGLVAAVVVLFVVVLGADDAAGRDGAASGSAPTSGCSEVTTQELYVQKAFTCPDSTRVLTFATTQSRDDYLKVAEGFGAVTVDKGATWAKVRI